MGTGYDVYNGVSLMKIDPKSAAESVVVIEATVNDLSPFTSYTCWAQTINTAGYSDLSDGVNATTLEDGKHIPK